MKIKLYHSFCKSGYVPTISSTELEVDNSVPDGFIKIEYQRGEKFIDLYDFSDIYALWLHPFSDKNWRYLVSIDTIDKTVDREVHGEGAYLGHGFILHGTVPIRYAIEN